MTTTENEHAPQGNKICLLESAKFKNMKLTTFSN